MTTSITYSDAELRELGTVLMAAQGILSGVGFEEVESIPPILRKLMNMTMLVAGDFAEYMPEAFAEYRNQLVLSRAQDAGMDVGRFIREDREDFRAGWARYRETMERVRDAMRDADHTDELDKD